MKKSKNERSSRIPFKEENETGNYAEFTVTRRPDREIKLKRFLFITLYIAFAAFWIILFTVITKMVPVVAVILIIEYILYLMTWHLTNIEYTYVVEKGNFHIFRLCGRTKAKEVFCDRVENTLGIYPLSDDDYKKELEGCAVELDFCDSKKSDDIYFALYEKDGKKTAIYFTAATKLLNNLKYFGGDKVIVTYVSH